MSKFPYKWYLKDGYPPSNGLKVFGTFICGGGSSMGYKLAGYEHLGGVEIDKKVADVYRTNHNPKYLYNEDIREFNKRTDLPSELFELDILDGSPPCSTFSMAGAREKGWGKEKQFREGQALQTLDDLVYVYCDAIIKLQPKTFILENVKGIIAGNAKSYSKKIVEKMTKAGYSVQVFLLNAASMGVPQKRERVFFIGSKKELGLPKLKLEFNERAVTFGEATREFWEHESGNLYAFDKYAIYRVWVNLKQGDSPKGSKFFNLVRQKDSEVCGTILSSSSVNSAASLTHSTYPRKLNNPEACVCGSYPLDYNFKELEPKYLIGMSVPPVMTAQIANQVYLQWFKNRQ